MKRTTTLQGRRFETDSADYHSSFAQLFAEAQTGQRSQFLPADPSDHGGMSNADDYFALLEALNPGLVRQPAPAPIVGVSPILPPDQAVLEKAISKYVDRAQNARNARRRQQALAEFEQIRQRWLAGERPLSD
jgi:hypothetical protein